MTPAEQLKSSIANLQAALEAGNPGMPTMLRTIHQAIRADKDLVTTLSEEETGVIVSGLLKQTNTVIATSVVKKSSKKAAKITMSDLGM